MSALIVAGRTVYLHCTEGVGRSPTVAIGYLHWSLGWGFDAAVCHVKQARQCSPHLEALRLALWKSGEPSPMSEAFDQSSGGILRHGRFGLSASRHVEAVRKAVEAPRRPASARKSCPAVRVFLRPQIRLLGFSSPSGAPQQSARFHALSWVVNSRELGPYVVATLRGQHLVGQRKLLGVVHQDLRRESK